jgi:hypothetical protein
MMDNQANSLLAVDLGLKTGLALYGQDGRLCWYRSKNYGSPGRLKKDVKNILGSKIALKHIVVEGGGELAEIWEREAGRRNISFRQINAEQWRQVLLYAREQKSGPIAKLNADYLARKIIKWSGMPGPTSLRHDAAEAIMIGLWGVIELGWLKSIPNEVRR